MQPETLTPPVIDQRTAHLRSIPMRQIIGEATESSANLALEQLGAMAGEHGKISPDEYKIAALKTLVVQLSDDIQRLEQVALA